MRDAILVRQGAGIKASNPRSGTFNTLLQATPVGTTQDLNKRGFPLFIAGSDLQDRHARGYEVEVTANVIKGLRVIGYQNADRFLKTLTLLRAP